MSTDRVALEEEREVLQRMLADLDDDLAAGDLTPEDHAEARAQYLARAAELDAALTGRPTAAAERADRSPKSTEYGTVGTESSEESAASVASESFEESAPSVTKPQVSGDADSEDSTVPRRRKRRPGFAVVGLLLIAAAALLGVMMTAGERGEDEPVTGAISRTSNGRIAQAQGLVSEGNVAGAVEIYFEVIDEDPKNPVALAELGWLLRIQGNRAEDPALRTKAVDGGLRYIDRALALDPTFAQAHFFRGMILLQDRDDPAGAATAFRAALETNPPDNMVSYLSDALRRAEEAAAAKAGAPAPTTAPVAGSAP